MASEEHLKKLKHFMWKYGGGMDRVDTFRISEADVAKVSAKFVVLLQIRVVLLVFFRMNMIALV